MSAEAKNFEAISKAKEQHNKSCPFPPHTVKMNPFEIERMQWEEGDMIAGLRLEADAQIGTGAFRLVCDGMDPPELEIEQTQVIAAPAEPLVVPAGPLREDEPRGGSPSGWRPRPPRCCDSRPMSAPRTERSSALPQTEQRAQVLQPGGGARRLPRRAPGRTRARRAPSRAQRPSGRR